MESFPDKELNFKPKAKLVCCISVLGSGWPDSRLSITSVIWALCASLTMNWLQHVKPLKSPPCALLCTGSKDDCKWERVSVWGSVCVATDGLTLCRVTVYCSHTVSSMTGFCRERTETITLGSYNSMARINNPVCFGVFSLPLSLFMLCNDGDASLAHSLATQLGAPRRTTPLANKPQKLWGLLASPFQKLAATRGARLGSY